VSTLRCGDRAFALGSRTFVMGIVNVTPDSFSGDGRALVDDAVAHALRQLDEGADLVDVGGESTRPGATPVAPDDECARVLPVVRALAARNIRCISVDTRHASTARACLDAGASWINDVSALDDPAMASVAAAADALVLMHWRKAASHDATGDHVRYPRGVVDEVRAFLDERVARAVAAGVVRARIVLDPGIGFGKSVDDNLALLKASFDGATVLVGPSRKRFIGALTGVDDAAQRVAGTLGAVAVAAMHGADFVRVHDVKATVECLKVVDAAVRK
jgi:dihydropteroate synthase